MKFLIQGPVIENACKCPFTLLCDESNERGDSVKLFNHTHHVL